ncbi:hypothetical protein AAULR_14184, partial [Lacticaseibacillus rhamnosus MTCC 5462]
MCFLTTPSVVMAVVYKQPASPALAITATMNLPTFIVLQKIIKIHSPL